MNQWTISLASWIIQDGNYGDFATGQRARFAVEFQLNRSLRPHSGAVGISSTSSGCLYKVVAQVTFKHEDVWVLNLGELSVFQEGQPPDDLEVGKIVETEIWLGVDPYFYFESLCKTPEIPPLIYEWEIERIEMQTAPFIESTDTLGGKLLVRDDTKKGYRTIERTNAWKDDDGNADYVLHCRKLDTKPTMKI